MKGIKKKYKLRKTWNILRLYNPVNKHFILFFYYTTFSNSRDFFWFRVSFRVLLCVYLCVKVFFCFVLGFSFVLMHLMVTSNTFIMICLKQANIIDFVCMSMQKPFFTLQYSVVSKGEASGIPARWQDSPQRAVWEQRELDVGAMHHCALLYYSTAASLCTQLLAAAFVNTTSFNCWQGTLHTS